MNILKKQAFWLCTLFSIIFFAVIYPLSVSSYTNAYYVLIFNALSIIGFACVLYRLLTQSFTESTASKLIVLLVILSLPHTVFCLLSYGSWVCLAVAVILIFLLFRQKKLHSNKGCEH